jgi:hypothetical protein
MHESGYYKIKLDSLAKEILEKSTQPQHNYESSYLDLEFDVFLVAHIINKLLNWETKLSDEFEKEQFSLEKLPRKSLEESGKIDIMNNNRWDEFYNADKTHKEQRKASFICDQLRHSFIFYITSEPVMTDNPLSESHVFKGFGFNSDKTKNEGLFYIEMNEFLKMINLAVSDFIISSEYRRNPETGKIKIKQTRLSLNPCEVEEWIRTGEERFYGP